MNSLITSKNPNAITLKGVTLDWTFEDKAATRLTITDKNGDSFTLVKGESYSRGFTVLQPKPQEMADRFAVSGKVKGVRVREVFATEGEAKSTIDSLTQYGAIDHSLEVKPVTVPVDDDGEVMLATDDIPF